MNKTRILHICCRSRAHVAVAGLVKPPWATRVAFSVSGHVHIVCAVEKASSYITMLFCQIKVIIVLRNQNIVRNDVIVTVAFVTTFVMG